MNNFLRVNPLTLEEKTLSCFQKRGSFLSQNKFSLGRFVLFSFLFFGLVHCSSGPSARTSRSARYAKAKPNPIINSSSDQPWRPKEKHTIPVVMNPRVKRWVNAFNGPLRKSFSKWVWRIGLYGPTLEQILIEEGAPPDLIYLSMIESGFNMTALSHASAAGPWQFIGSTGRMYGLNRDFFVDQRSDFFKATRAAAKHLKDLHKIYGDWYLAFAAYNAGPGKVNQAIKRGRSKDYWHLSSSRSRLFRQETKDYVPKILAALHIVKNYSRYGYSKNSFGNPLAYERVTVPDATDISVIAKSAKTSPEIIRTLNPSLNVGITPPGQQFSVYIPKGAADEFKSRYSRIPSSKRVSSLTYKTGHGESLSSISHKYKVSLASLNKLNSYPSGKKLRAGTTVRLPATNASLLSLAKAGYTSGQGQSKTVVKYYRVRPGDTLSKIAHRHRTSVSKIAKLNHIGPKKGLRVGQKIKVYQQGTVKQYASSGSFVPGASIASFASASNIDNTPTKLSGVAHIIMQETPSSNGSKQITFVDTQDSENNAEEQDTPFLLATAEEFTSDTEDQPALIKTIEGEVFSAEAKDKEKQNISEKKTKPHYYTVKKGDTLSIIARKHDITINALKALNGLKSNNIHVRQKLAVSKPEKVTRIESSYYVVKKGDSLSQIAENNHITVQNLKSLNQLQGNEIRLGQKLRIKGQIGKTNPVRPNTMSESTDKKAKIIVHKVRPGETLWSLAKKYKVKVSDIKKWNRLTTNTVKTHQNLKIEKS